MKGLCAAPAINLSGNTILTGETCTGAEACLDVFPFNDYFDDLAGGLPISKILTWQPAWVTTASLPAGFVAPCGDAPTADCEYDDLRDPSRYFMVYETGESSGYDAGEAPPLDLFYSRAVDWGDDYLVWQDEADTSACLPSAEDTELAGFCNEFDALEGSQFSESGEASVTCSPGGEFFYATWNQWDFENANGELGDEILADAIFRRVWFLDDYIPSETSSTAE